MDNLPVKGLNFQDLKASFQAFLRGDQAYKDFNFEASGISSLLNILAYHGHYLGYYIKMMLDESFVDSAHTRSAMLAHAKRTGYVVNGKRSARADVRLKLNIPLADDPLSRNVVIPAGLNFSGSNTSADSRVYQIVDDVVMYDRSVVGSIVTYTSPTFTIFEGTAESYRFEVDGADLNQRFIIRDRDIDVSTLRVDIIPFLGSEDAIEYKLADDIFELKNDSEVYFVTTNEDGYYQIFFGNGVFGKKPSNGNIIRCRYVSTNGETGNGAKVFTFNPVGFGIAPDFSTETVSIASGGMEEEGVESLRFTIPHHERRQNRIVTESDYRAVLLSNFRNIDSLNVWGGERNGQREYGKVFISIKPRFSDSLTSSARNEIRNSVIQKYGHIGIDIEFIDPQFIETDVIVFGRIDQRKTNDSLRVLEGKLLTRLQEFNASELSKFDTILSDVQLLDYLKSGLSSVVTLYTKKKLRKNHTVIHRSTSTNRVEFSNSFVPGIQSSLIRYAGSDCYMKDESGFVYLFKFSDNSKILQKPVGSVDYSLGIIDFVLPVFAEAKGFEGLYSGTVEFTVTPENPDVNTSLNNIVRIANTKVSLT